MSWALKRSMGGRCAKTALTSSSNRVLGFLVAFMAVSTLAGSSAEANCADILTNHVYRCQVKSDKGDEYSDCFRFDAPGTPAEDLNLRSDAINNPLLCDCKVSGTFAAPQFGQADSYHCITPIGLPFVLSLDGTIVNQGKRIKGQGINDVATSFFFRCDRARTCALPATSASIAASKWRP